MTMTAAKTIDFFAGSDDVFAWACRETKERDEQDNCANGHAMAYRITHDDDELCVVGFYAPMQCPIDAPTWLIGVQQSAEDKPIPDWPVRIRMDACGYSPVFSITVPKDAKVEVLDA